MGGGRGAGGWRGGVAGEGWDIQELDAFPVCWWNLRQQWNNSYPTTTIPYKSIKKKKREKNNSDSFFLISENSGPQKPKWISVPHLQLEAQTHLIQSIRTKQTYLSSSRPLHISSIKYCNVVLCHEAASSCSNSGKMRMLYTWTIISDVIYYMRISHTIVQCLISPPQQQQERVNEWWNSTSKMLSSITATLQMASPTLYLTATI